MTRPSDDDAGICRDCGTMIFRTNMDGRWHHPRREIDDDHEPRPRDE